MTKIYLIINDKCRIDVSNCTIHQFDFVANLLAENGNDVKVKREVLKSGN